MAWTLVRFPQNQREIDPPQWMLAILIGRIRDDIPPTVEIDIEMRAIEKVLVELVKVDGMSLARLGERSLLAGHAKVGGLP